MLLLEVDSGAISRHSMPNCFSELCRAALNVFQKSSATPGEEPLLSNSTVVTYVGLDRREGLVSIAKQLLQSECFVISPLRSRLLKVMAQKLTSAH